MSDNRNINSAYSHIEAAKAAPHRAELELQQAENYARLVQDSQRRQEIIRQIDEKR